MLDIRPRLQVFLDRLLPVLRQLADPLDMVFDPAQRRQARLLNYLLLPVFASLAFLMLRGGGRNGVLFLAVDFFVLAIIFLLNRVGLYSAAALALTLLISAATFATMLGRAAVGAMLVPAGTLMWITPAILIAYLLLPLRSTVVLTVANLVGILLVPVVSSLSFNAILPSFYFTVVIALLILLSTVWRNRYLVQFEQQSRELAESEARFRNLLEASFETIVVHKDGVVLDVNPAVEHLVGYKPEEIIGQSGLLFIEPAYHRVAVESYENNNTDPYEVLLRHRNGTVLHAEMRGKRQWYRGEMVRVVAVRDITELRNHEELTVEREKVRVLQKFIGDLSHDLRTPLSVINTSIYLIERLAKDPDRQRQQIDVLQDQATHIQRMLEDLISMARLDKADTSDFKFQWVNLNDPVSRVVEEQQNLALRKRQKLACQLAEDLPHVLLDTEQFRLALKHLILNGLSYTGEGGTVTVETMDELHHVRVQVRDNGAGIAAEDLPHIFEQFYRADPSRGDKGGTGVGLTIARKIVEAHRGKIEAESEPGHGSIFRILLPKPPE